MQQVQDCHDEIAVLTRYVAVIEEMREKNVAGCLTVNVSRALAFKNTRVLLYALQILASIYP